MSDFSDRLYRPSGSAPITGIATMLTVGTLAAAALGTVYALLCYYNPIIYVTFVGAIFFGLGMGFAIQYGVRIGKVRNPKVVFGVSLILALLSLYFCWVAYISLLINNAEDLEGWVVIFDPLALWNIIQVMAANGVWEIRGATPTGSALYTVWVIEALLISGAAILWGACFDSPFCEDCNRWTKSKDLDAKIPLEHANDFVQSLGEERYSSLMEFRKGEVNEDDCIHLTAHRCPMCEDSNFLTATRTMKSTNDKGEEVTNTEQIFDHMIVPHEVIVGLSKLSAETPATITEEIPVAENEAIGNSSAAVEQDDQNLS